MTGKRENLSMLKEGCFAANESANDEIKKLGEAIKKEENLYLNSQGAFVTEKDKQNLPQTENLNRVNNDPFAALEIPANKDQWYNKNRALFEAEVAVMREKYPDAVLGFLKTTGNMYWVFRAEIAKSVEPWTFLLEYEKNHPHNHSYGGSIKVQLLQSPSLEDLKKKAELFGRPGVPHLVTGKRADTGEQYPYLCTRFPKDIQQGKDIVTSAVQVAGWAADWAVHYECGLRDKEVWNKWVEGTHFGHMKI